MYTLLDPEGEARYLVQNIRFSSKGIRLDQVKGTIHTSQYYLAMEFS